MSSAEYFFAANGYDRAGMRDIAEAAEVTASALYNYFPSKAVLYGVAWAAARWPCG